MKIKRYREKSDIYEAIQWRGIIKGEIENLLESNGMLYHQLGIYLHFEKPGVRNSGHSLRIGDYIVRNTRTGEFFPILHNLFDKTMEEI